MIVTKITQSKQFPKVVSESFCLYVIVMSSTIRFLFCLRVPYGLALLHLVVVHIKQEKTTKVKRTCF